MSVPKNCSGNVAKSILKHGSPVFKIFGYKHCETVIRISSSIEVNHLISKELYQKQNGFKFI